MKPSTDQCLGIERLVSSDSSDTQTATIPKGTSHVLITVETTTCRMTLSSGGDPTSAVAHVVQKDQMPWLLLVGQGSTLKFASTAGTSSVIVISYLS